MSKSSFARLVTAARFAVLGCMAFAASASQPGSLVDRVHTYASGEAGIFANAYVIDAGTGLVVIDTTLSVSDSAALRSQVDSLGKPLLAVLLTHGHPDHYNGVTTLAKDRTVPVVATAAVDRVIREWDTRKEEQWKPVFKEEWPSKRTFPNRIVRNGATLTFGDLRFTVRDLGPGESYADTWWVVKGSGGSIAFIGDLAFNGFHSYLTDGHSGDWLANLARAKKELASAKILYPGHGAAGGLELLDRESQYLSKYRETVASLAKGRTVLSDAEKSEVTNVMTAYLPQGKLTFLIPLGADPVAAELAGSAR